VVNIGCDAVFNSDNFREYARRNDLRYEYEHDTEAAFDVLKGGKKNYNNIINLECDKMKRELDMMDSKSMHYLNSKSAYENTCTEPEWVIEELIFVFAAILCMVVSVICFLSAIFSEKCSSMKVAVSLDISYQC